MWVCVCVCVHVPNTNTALHNLVKWWWNEWNTLIRYWWPHYGISPSTVKLETTTISTDKLATQSFYLFISCALSACTLSARTLLLVLHLCSTKSRSSTHLFWKASSAACSSELKLEISSSYWWETCITHTGIYLYNGITQTHMCMHTHTHTHTHIVPICPYKLGHGDTAVCQVITYPILMRHLALFSGETLGRYFWASCRLWCFIQTSINGCKYNHKYTAEFTNYS